MKTRTQISLLAILAIGTLLLAGCAPAMIQLDPRERARLKDYPVIHTVQYNPARLGVMTVKPDGSAGLFAALIEAAIAGSDHEKEKDAENIPIADPAIAVGAQLLSAVTAGLSLTNVRAAEPQTSDDPANLKVALGPGHVLDIKTEGWLMVYYPTDWHHYRVVYRARSRLVRLGDGKVLWQGACFFRNEDPSTSPTMDEMVANDGAVLKAKVDEAASACAQQLVAQFFGRETGKEGDTPPPKPTKSTKLASGKR